MKSNIQNILDRTFEQQEKKRIIETDNGYRFACPYCGDSASNPRKKRGNIYNDSNFFVCYNCSTKKPTLAFLSDFNEALSLDSILTIKESMRSNKTNYNRNIDLSDIEDIVIKRDDFERDYKIKRGSNDHPILKARGVKNFDNIGTKGDDIYVYNMLGEYIIGLTIRRANRKPKYKAYTLNQIWKDFYSTEIRESQFVKDYSLLFNYFQINTSKVLTIVEGPIDATFIPNTVAIGGVSKSMRPFDFFDNKRVWFDNDKTGKDAMKKLLLNQNLSIFMWDKFIRDFNLPNDIKDINDLYMVNPVYIEEAEKYFTNQKIDLLYV